MNGGRITCIPASGVPLLDNIQYHLGDKRYEDTAFRLTVDDDFRQICRNVARGQNSHKEKIIWVTAAINTINQTFVVANSSSDNPIISLTLELCAILESEFLQIPDPICTKRIAMEIGVLDIFQEIAVNLLLPEGKSAKVEYMCATFLHMEMGASGPFFQKKVCIDCDVSQCPYDVYWRLCMETGEDNEKFRSLTPEEAFIAAKLEEPIVFPSLDSPLSCAQKYFEALYPVYLDKDLKLKGTNYAAYWLALMLKTKFPNITIQSVGDYFGIKNLRSYRREALKRTSLRDTMIALLRKRHLEIPDVK